MSHNIYYGKLFLEINDEPIVAGFDAVRQFRTQLAIVQTLIHVSQHSAPRTHTGDPGQRFCEMSVGRMSLTAQAVDDPELDPFERGECVVVELGDVGRVGKSADPET